MGIPSTIFDGLRVLGPLQVTGDYLLEGNLLSLGSPPLPVLQRVDNFHTGQRTLFLNPANAFQDVTFGGGSQGPDLRILRVPSFLSNGTQLHVTVGDVSPSGTLRSAGSVRARAGLPSNSSDLGFAFDEWHDTGLFAGSAYSGRSWSHPHMTAQHVPPL